MSESDEPGESEEVPGLDDLLDSEFLDEVDDDALLDRIGAGDDDFTLYEYLELDDVEAALVDRLNDARDEVEEIPLPASLDPENIIAKHLQQKRATPPGPRTPSEGSTVSALSDIAAQVRAQADVTEILAAIEVAKSLIEAKEQAVQALLADTPHGEAVSAAAGQAHNVLFNAHGPVQQLSAAIEEAAGKILGG